jgi:hypothetical protein
MLLQYKKLLRNNDLINFIVPCLISIFSKSGYVDNFEFASDIWLNKVIYLWDTSKGWNPSILMSIFVVYHNSFANIISKFWKFTILSSSIVDWSGESLIFISSFFLSILISSFFLSILISSFFLSIFISSSILSSLWTFFSFFTRFLKKLIAFVKIEVSSTSSSSSSSSFFDISYISSTLFHNFMFLSLSIPSCPFNVC